MASRWRVGRLMGIDIAVDRSWFIILLLLVYTLGFVEFPHQLHPRTFFPRSDSISIILGLIASIMLFASVLAHELSHSWMAVERGIPVKRITLFIFGGVAQIADEPDTPGTEFLVAVMGPLMSASLAAVFGGAWLWLQILDTPGRPLLPLVILTGMLTQANGALALFNLAPGFPLDGGRVLRAILWRVSGSEKNATRWATLAGQVIAVILVAWGLWIVVTEMNIGGLWYGFTGLFLWSMARESYRQLLVREMLKSARVETLMTPVPEPIAPQMTLDQFAWNCLARRRDEVFVVYDGDRFLGTVSLGDLGRFPRKEWDARTVAQVMTPSSKQEPLSPAQTAATALSKLNRSGIDTLPVFDGHNLVGLLGRVELNRFLHLRTLEDRK